MELPIQKTNDRITTTTSTMITRPISCPAPSPTFSPKRKYFDSEDIYDISRKKPRLSVSETDTQRETPESPLYKNYGNGLSLCNNTKTNRFANIDEVLRYLAYEDNELHSCTAVNEKTLSEDIFNEIIDDLYETKELPELTVNLWDLRDILHLDFKF